MTIKHLLPKSIAFLIIIAFSFISCKGYSNKPPVHEIYEPNYDIKSHFGSYFYTFQNGFLNILLFIILFTLFQYWQNRQRDYIYYAAYLFISWLYFIKSLPPYFYFLFTTKPEYMLFKEFMRPKGGGGFSDQTEFIVFNLLIISYQLFANIFFQLKDKLPSVYKVNRQLLFFFIAAVILQVLFLIIGGKDYYVKGLPQILLKIVYVLPAIWLMQVIIQAKLPGATYIVIGSGTLLAASIFVGLLHIFGDPLLGKRVFLQIGVLVEILFFSAALGRKDRAMREEKATLEHDYQSVLDDLQNYKQPSLSLQKERSLFKEHNLLKELNRLIEDVLEERKQQNEAAKFSVADFARKLGKSHSTLYREIKELAGESIGEYVLNYRLEMAHRLLQTTQLPIKEIAYLAGFKEHSTLTKAFRKKFSYPPSELRKHHALPNVTQFD